MKSKINHILVAGVIGTVGLGLTACTDLDETIYQNIASETHVMSE